MDSGINTKYVIGVVVGIVILLTVFVVINNRSNNPPGPDLTKFAMCLKDSGAIFYGAFWCPHCAATKKMFGNASKYLPYRECSTPDGSGQVQECTAAGVKGYPTWVFKDGTRVEGETSLTTLSSMSGCPLPTEATSASSTSAGGSSSATQSLLPGSPAISSSSTVKVGK
jgi:hypothetical protein